MKKMSVRIQEGSDARIAIRGRSCRWCEATLPVGARHPAEKCKLSRGWIESCIVVWAGMGSTNTNGSHEKAILVGLVLPDVSRDQVQEHLEELQKLTESAGGSVAGTIVQERRGPDPATYIGRGKVETLAEMVRRTGS